MARSRRPSAGVVQHGGHAVRAQRLDPVQADSQGRGPEHGQAGVRQVAADGDGRSDREGGPQHRRPPLEPHVAEQHCQPRQQHRGAEHIGIAAHHRHPDRRHGDSQQRAGPLRRPPQSRKGATADHAGDQCERHQVKHRQRDDIGEPRAVGERDDGKQRQREDQVVFAGKGVDEHGGAGPRIRHERIGELDRDAMKVGIVPEVDEALLAHVGAGQRTHGERQRDDQPARPLPSRREVGAS